MILGSLKRNFHSFVDKITFRYLHAVANVASHQLFVSYIRLSHFKVMCIYNINDHDLHCWGFIDRVEPPKDVCSLKFF